MTQMHPSLQPKQRSVREMVRLAVAIQHHPSRADLLPRILAELPDALVVTDPDPTAHVRSPWRTYRACLDAIPADATHLLVIQDDAVPCRDFAATLVRVIAARPDDALCLFTPGIGLLARAIMDACSRDERWVELPSREWCPVVALVLPRRMVDDLRAWAAGKNLPAWERSDDALMGRFCRESGRRVWATMPSLVDHADDVPSLVGNPAFAGLNPGRVAACWAGREWSPLGLDWG